MVSRRVLDVTSHELMTDYLAAGERGDWDVGDGIAELAPMRRAVR